MIDQEPARAIINRANSDQWPPHSAPPDPGFGTALGAGAWLEHDARTIPAALLGPRRIWRNPALWDETERFASLEVWQPAQATGWFPLDWLRRLKQWTLDLAAVRTPFALPWSPAWHEVGGTQAQAADNGCIVTLTDGTTVEIQGMAPLGPLDVAAINLRALSDVARIGDFRVDAIRHRRPGVDPHGSQGPVWKADGLLRPQHLERLVDRELSLVVANTEWGPLARAVPPGWVEHRNSQPFAGRLGGAIIPDIGAGKVPNFLGLAVDITDLQIERWINWAEISAPGPSPTARRWLARNMRGYERDTDRPATLPTRIRVRESGTGHKILESNGDLAGFAAHGVTPANCGDLAAGILTFGRLTVTAGLDA